MEQVQEEKKKRGAPKGRAITDAQREGLKKGFEALKAKREAMKKEKELSKEKPLSNELPINNQIVANKPLDNPPGKVIKKRNRVPPVSRDDFLSFKNDILNVIKPQVTEKVDVQVSQPVIARLPVVQPVVPSIVSPIQTVEQPKILTGSDLLNKIFFNK